jgi:hypothetical protein
MPCFTPRKHNRCIWEWEQCCLFFSITEAFCNTNPLLNVRQLLKVSFYLAVLRCL